jgi:ribose transport system substrate-binding protein
MFPNRAEDGGDIYDTGLKLVVPDESSPLNAEMFDEKTQFMTLPEFQAWLDKYGLKGS